jgi:hypothetical protein
MNPFVLSFSITSEIITMQKFLYCVVIIFYYGSLGSLDIRQNRHTKIWVVIIFERLLGLQFFDPSVFSLAFTNKIMELLYVKKSMFILKTLE